jgi:hypothetical protein
VDEFGRFLQVEADFKGFSRLSDGDEFAGMLRACQNPPRRNVRAMAIASPVFIRMSAFEGLFGDPRARVIALTRRSKNDVR